LRPNKRRVKRKMKRKKRRILGLTVSSTCKTAIFRRTQQFSALSVSKQDI